MRCLYHSGYGVTSLRQGLGEEKHDMGVRRFSKSQRGTKTVSRDVWSSTGLLVTNSTEAGPEVGQRMR